MNLTLFTQVNDFGSSVGFGPGDTVFLEGYFTDAPIVISLTTSFGTAAQPLRFTSWSSAAMATIAYPNQNGFYIYAHGATPLGLGIQIDHLVFRGNGQARSNGVATAGIFLDFQPNSAASIDILIIYNVDISGYMYGITTFRGAAGGFIRDVNITNSVVHDNVEGSTTRSGKGTYSYIGRSGSGIFLSGVQNALIDSVSAFNNGGGSQQNPVGIGIQDSETVVIRNCTCSAGGGGFELSSGTTNAVIEDSFSLDNGGPGFRVMSESIANLNGVGSCSNITIEGSSSVGDGGINGFYALGVITGPGVISSNIFFQNMSITVTANDPPFQQFGNSSSIGFTGIYLTGTFDNVETRNASFLFPSSVSYNCDLNCASSQTPSFCECMS